MINRHKIINGKRYFKFKRFNTKGQAVKRSDIMKATGRFETRILPDGDKYALFCRKI